MIRQLPLFIFSLLPFAAFAQSESFIEPAYFLKESSAAPEYETAYLVTEGDTLISWSKQGNRTIVTYLNTKVTKTVWADSIEVCKQVGFMLDDFQEYCLRKSRNNKVLTESYKNVNQYLRLNYSGKGIQVYWKSFSKGILKEGLVTEEEKNTLVSESKLELPIDSMLELTKLLLSCKIESRKAKVVFVLITGDIVETPAEINIDQLYDDGN